MHVVKFGVVIFGTGEGTGNRSPVQLWPWICSDGERDGGDGG